MLETIKGNGKDTELGVPFPLEEAQQRIESPKGLFPDLVEGFAWTVPVERKEEKKIDLAGTRAEEKMVPRTVVHTVFGREEEKLETPSDSYIRVMRKHFVSPILRALDEIQPYAQSPDSALYVNKILHTIRDMEKRSPKDPFLEILLAFYDALNIKGAWATYTANQFSKARAIIAEFSKRQPMRSDAFEKVIIQFEQNGFDTTPISIDFEEENE